jgi:hypothetical protein
MHGSMQVMRIALALMFTVACGDNATAPDAAVLADSQVDSRLLPAGCSFAELHDAYNERTPELTNLRLGSSAITICGSIHAGHFDATAHTVDTDSFALRLDASADVLVTLSGALEGLASVRLQVYTGTNFITAVKRVTFLHDHAVMSVRLPFGMYKFVVTASNAQAIDTDIDYKLSIRLDDPVGRCPTKQGDPDLLESTPSDNDVLEVRHEGGTSITETPSTTAVPEPMPAPIASATAYSIAATMEDVDGPDEYRGRDTFALTTGPTTNQLAIRMAWPGSSTDLDFLLVDATSLDILGRSLRVSKSAPEFDTMAVKPSTTYWLWAGGYEGSALPVDYNVTICGEHFD